MIIFYEGDSKYDGVYDVCHKCGRYLHLKDGKFPRHQRHRPDASKRICSMSGKTWQENKDK